MNSSGQESGTVSFSREQYEMLESIVMESPRGRWFLAEYAKRNRAADTMMLLDALKKLENATAAHPLEPDKPLPVLDELVSHIRAARSDIASTHNDRLPESGYLVADGAIYGRIASDAKSASGEIARRSVSLRVIAGGLKAAAADEQHVEAVETNARSLETLSWSQQVLSERIAKAMGLLSHLDETLNGLSAQKGDAATDPPYFSRDEDLFEPMLKHIGEAPAASEKPRIVVIRRGKDDPLDIPLSG